MCRRVVGYSVSTSRAFGERVDERDALDGRPRREVLREHYGNLVQLGRRPDLRVIVGELVVPDAPDRLEHNGWRERVHRERPLVEADLAVHVVGRDGRLEPAHRHARELGERLGRERARRTGRGRAPDAGEDVERPGLLFGLIPVDAVDEYVRVEEVPGHRYPSELSPRPCR